MKPLATLLVALIALVSLPAQAEPPLLDDDWTIKPGASQEYTVTLTAPGTFQIEIRGVKHADKGFKVELSQQGTEIARTFRRTVNWSAGSHYLRIKNTENLLNRVTVHVRLSATQRSAAAPSSPTPQKVGECVETTVSRLGTRLQGGGGSPVPGSGTAIVFANGIGLVSYDIVPEAEDSKAGDSVTLCLSDIPKDCPPGDDRGRTYTVSNSRTKKKFSMANSQHSCGGA